MDITTTDVKANLDDLKVLGKGDFKTLLKWRIALREEVCTRFTHTSLIYHPDANHTKFHSSVWT